MMKVLGETYLVPNHTESVVGKLYNANIITSISQIHGVIVVYQNTQIIVTLRQRIMLRPLARRILRGEDVRLRKIDTSIPVIQPVALAVAHGAGPDSINVGGLPILEVVLVTKGESWYGVAEELPVDEVIRAQDGGAGRVVHRGGRVVEGVFDTEDVNVGKVLPDDGVGEGILSRYGGHEAAHGERR